MQIKAVLIDFDGTLVTRDILDVICGIVGKEEESARLNEGFQKGLLSGLETLIQRINFLKGVSLADIKNKLDQDDYLRKGAKEFLDFINNNHIISILYSGNLELVLQYYQQKLGIKFIVGTKPKMDGDQIDSISKKDFSGGDISKVDFSGSDFKFVKLKKALEKLGILSQNVIAIGDSPADKHIFEFAAKSIAVNPKGGIENYADFVIRDDLSKAIPILKELMETP